MLGVHLLDEFLELAPRDVVVEGMESHFNVQRIHEPSPVGVKEDKGTLEISFLVLTEPELGWWEHVALERVLSFDLLLRPTVPVQVENEFGKPVEFGRILITVIVVVVIRN
jgi:hypothetical protein